MRIEAVLAQADTLSADSVRLLAQALGTEAAQDTFYKRHLQAIYDQEEMAKLSQNLDCYERLRGKAPYANALILYWRSQQDYLDNNLKAGTEKLEQALQIKEIERDTQLRIDILYSLATQYQNDKQLEKATKLCLEGIALATPGDNKLNLADGQIRMASICQWTVNNDKALEYYRLALPSYIAASDTQYMADCYENIAKIYSYKGDTTKAFRNMDTCLYLRLSINTLYHTVNSYCQYADILRVAENYPRALEASIAAENWQKRSGSKIFEYVVNFSMGRSLFLNGQYKEAKKYLTDNLERAKADQDTIEQIRSCEVLSQLYQKEHDLSAAFPYLQQVYLLKDKLNEIEVQKIIRRQEIKEITEKKDREITEFRHKEAITRQRALIIILLLCLALMGALLLFARQRNQRKRVEQQFIILETEQQLAKARETLQRQALNRTEADLINKNAELEQIAQLLKLKSQMIDDLQLQVSLPMNDPQPSAAPGSNFSISHRHTFSNLKILTETDWIAFQKQFEGYFPLLIPRIQAQFKNLNPAEIRLFLLLKVGFDTKEISSILGISVESVWKSRHRLKKKLGLDEKGDFDGFISDFQ